MLKKEEIVYGINKSSNLKDVGKKYSFSDDISIYDIANMLQNGNYPVDFIQVSVDDEYPYGQGRYTFEEFFESYDGVLSVSSVSFVIDTLNAIIVVFPEDRLLYLNFDDVKEMPAMEITDIIGEKLKM